MERSVSIIEQIYQAPFPVYGSEDKPFGFTVSSFSTGRKDGNLGTVDFVFADSLKKRQGKEVFHLASSDSEKPDQTHPSIGEIVTPKYNLHHWLFKKYQLEAEIPQFAALFSSWEGEFIIAGNPFLGEIYSWTLPYQMTLFLFRGKQTNLYGDTIGPVLNRVQEQLQQLVLLNQRIDLLTRYQHEFDEERQQRREQYRRD